MINEAFTAGSWPSESSLRNELNLMRLKEPKAFKAKVMEELYDLVEASAEITEYRILDEHRTVEDSRELRLIARRVLAKYAELVRALADIRSEDYIRYATEER